MKIRKKILVVDDEEMLREMMNDALTMSCPGMEVVTAENGIVGNQFFIEYHKDIALVIADNTMPGIKGVALVELMKKIDGTVPIILMTGDYEKPENHGANLLLSKPCKLPELIAIIQAFLPHELATP